MKKNNQNVSYFLQLIRYQNLIIIVLTLFFTKYFLIDSTADQVPLNWLFLSASTLLVAAGGYLINDFYDIAIDKINKPNKVLIDKIFTQKTSWFVYIAFNIFAVFLGFCISVVIGLSEIVCVLSLWLYAFYLKKTPLFGNLLVAFLSAFVVLIVNLMYEAHFLLVYVFGVFAFFISLIRELIKDIEDIEGDKVGKCSTFPILFGIGNAKMLIYCLIVIFIALLFAIPHLANMGQKLSNISHGIISLLLLLLAYRLYWAEKKSDFHWLSSFCKLLMLAGMIGMALLKIG